MLCPGALKSLMDILCFLLLPDENIALLDSKETTVGFVLRVEFVSPLTGGQSPARNRLQAISYMPQQNYAAAKVEHSEKVLSVSFVADN